MGGESKIVIPWSDLPRDILEKIAKCLDTEIDFLGFRAVCSSWRSSTTPFTSFSCETVKLPFPFDARERFEGPRQHGAYFTLTERTVYRFELPDSKKPNFWLVKIERLRNGKLRILNPVSHRQVKILPETQMPKVLNTVDFRVSELCKARTLRYVNPSKPDQDYEFDYAKKVLFSVDKNDEYVVMAIDKSDKLWYTKSGHEKWTMVRDYNACFGFYDIMKYKWQIHGIDVWGGTWAFESTRVSYNMPDDPLKRHLVELDNGELFLVEQVRNKNLRRPRLYNIIDEGSCGLRRTTAKKRDMDIVIYVLDKNEKEWVEMNAVDDCIFVVGDDCSYSISTKEFDGCKGTRVFYPEWCLVVDEDDMFVLYHTSSECNCGDCYDAYDDDDGLDNFIPSDEVKLRFR